MNTGVFFLVVGKPEGNIYMEEASIDGRIT
jgi:hypothetical protein